MIELDKGHDIPAFSEVCTYCKNLIDTNKRVCKAFDTIPMAIWLGKSKHLKPFPGDHGIQFERIKK